MMTILIALFLSAQAGTSQIELPPKAKQALNIALTVKWQLSKQFFHQCELNGDSLPDYAMKLTVGEDNCVVEYDVALIADPDGYGFHLLGARPTWLSLAPNRAVLRRKGETIPDFEHFDHETGQPREIVLQTDAIEFIPSVGCCAVIFIFKNGRFQLRDTSD